MKAAILLSLGNRCIATPHSAPSAINKSHNKYDTTMRKTVLILASLLLMLTACTKEGDVIYQTDPAEFILYNK